MTFCQILKFWIDVNNVKLISFLFEKKRPNMLFLYIPFLQVSLLDRKNPELLILVTSFLK